MVNKRQHIAVVVMFLVTYLMATVVIPCLVYPNLPLDTIEAIGWGKQWQWGYDKHPYLSAWAAAVAAWCSHPHAWGLYVLSALCVLIALAAVFAYVRARRGLLDAYTAVCLSASVYLYTITTLEFNVNVLLLPLVAVFMCCFPRAIKQQAIKHWLVLGLCVGLGVVTKYTMVLYVMPALLWLLWHPQGRYSFRCVGLYIAVAMVLLVVLPHAVWLVQHDWTTIVYALHRGDSASSWMQSWPHWSRHVVYPVKLLMAFLLPLLSVWLIDRCCLRVQWCDRSRLSWQDDWDRYAWPAMLAVLLLLAAMGLRVRSPYLLPMMVWVGPYWVCCFKRQRVFSMRVVCLVCGLILVYSVAYAVATGMKADRRHSKLTRSFFMGSALASQAEQIWSTQAAAQPLRYVAGDRWLAGNIGFYARSYPQSLFTPVSLQRERQAWQKSGVLLVLSKPSPADQVRWQVVLKSMRRVYGGVTMLRRGQYVMPVTWAVYLPR